MNLTYFNLKNSIFSVGILIAAVFALNSCSKSSPKPTQTTNSNSVAITSLSISQGSYYASVTIKGTGFDPNFANDQVFFNGKRAVIDLASTTEIFAHVPLAAGTGNVTIKVNGASATGPIFTYIPALVVSTFAGGLPQGDVNGTGDTARFVELSAIAIDKNDNLYVADHGTFKIRKITPQAQVTTYAGTGHSGSIDGTTSTATFGTISGMTLDQQGNMYIIDEGLFRKITAAGNVSTVPLSISGNASQVSPEGICTDISGNVYITSWTNGNVGKVAASGQVAIVSGSYHFTSPWGIAADNSGNLFVGDSGALYKITSSNIVSQFNIGIPVLGLQQPEGVAVDSQGNVYIADSTEGCIAKVTSAGIMSIYAGSIGSSLPGADGLTNLAGFTFPVGVVVDSKGNIFVADAYSVREIAFQ